MRKLFARLAGWYLRTFAPATSIVFNRPILADGGVPPVTADTRGWISGPNWHVNLPGGE